MLYWFFFLFSFFLFFLFPLSYEYRLSIDDSALKRRRRPFFFIWYTFRYHTKFAKIEFYSHIKTFQLKVVTRSDSTRLEILVFIVQ